MVTRCESAKRHVAIVPLIYSLRSYSPQFQNGAKGVPKRNTNPSTVIAYSGGPESIDRHATDMIAGLWPWRPECLARFTLGCKLGPVPTARGPHGRAGQNNLRVPRLDSQNFQNFFQKIGSASAIAKGPSRSAVLLHAGARICPPTAGDLIGADVTE